MAVLFSVNHPVTFALARRLKNIFNFSHLRYGNFLENLYKLLPYLSFEIVKFCSIWLNLPSVRTVKFLRSFEEHLKKSNARTLITLFSMFVCFKSFP